MWPRALGDEDWLPVWSLPRLGVEVRNDPGDLRLRLGARELNYRPGQGWRALGGLSLPAATYLPAPQALDGSLHAPLSALRALGLNPTQTPQRLSFPAPAQAPAGTLGPSADEPGTGEEGQPLAPAFSTFLTTVRIGRELIRSVEVQRVVLELSAPAPYEVSRAGTGLSLNLGGVSASPSARTLASGDALEVAPGEAGTTVTLLTGGGRSTVQALDNPFQVVIDTVTHLNPRVPPPPNPAALPPGVRYEQRGLLTLLSFDPARYAARVVSAPRGQFSNVGDLVKRVGGVAGVNASYFDPLSRLPVDMVVSGGALLFPSLERRGSVGFTGDGELLFGYPKPRYRIEGPFGTLYSNSVGTRPRREWLLAFVGDGVGAVGAPGFVTLALAGGVITWAGTGPTVPPAGTLTLTFDPAQFPQLPRVPGAPLSAQLDWRATDAPWEEAREALSAGPLLVQGGRAQLDPVRERFDTSQGVWRATRQVALGRWQGQPTIIYYEYGTPESFAAALVRLGVSDALRLDSGSSASAYVSAGYGALGGYLNAVWGQPVPNALVFVPRAREQGFRGKGN